MELIGHKTKALFDLWSICHFFTGIAIGGVIEKSLGKKFVINGKTSLFFILILAYSWELLEFILESGGAGADIAYWFHGREYYLNRLLCDPLLVLVGYVTGQKFPLLTWPVRVLLVGWLWLFTIILPHSMAYY